MAEDKPTQILIEALAKARAGDEHRFYKSGKSPGLFASRAGANAEAAARALRENYLEITRTEEGKTPIEWVRLTAGGRAFLNEKESPVQALTELRAVLQTNQDGIPHWLAQLQEEIRAVRASLAESMQRLTQRLQTLGERVDEALRRFDVQRAAGADGVNDVAPWALAALALLDRHRKSGPCPLPELFATLRRDYADLSIVAFHDGLRQLRDRKALQLTPFAGVPAELPEPEYAMLDGARFLYYASR